MKTHKMPKFLHEVHGETSSIRDLVIVYAFALSVTFVNYYLLKDSNLSPGKLILYLIIVFDISGGVIANFTYSTNKYYNENSGKRRDFLSLHVLQPTIILFVFSSEYPVILVLSVFTLISSFILDEVEESNFQKILGILLTGIGLISLYFFKCHIISLNIVLQLFMLKLILGFSVRWNLEYYITDHEKKNTNYRFLFVNVHYYWTKYNLNICPSRN